jgi:hypothetical protein
VLTLPTIEDRQVETIAKEVTYNGRTEIKHMFKAYYTVNYKFIADDNSSIDISIACEGCDPQDKATAKAMSNAHKTALFQMFMIPTEDNQDSDQQEDNGLQDLEAKALAAIKKSDINEQKRKVAEMGIKQHKYGAEILERWANGEFK